ncbi:carbohydrate kinase [Dentipellis sp. KUC8613]|nr:carbohydrate kinase [Dentipellis sp. KUC8613]
MPEETLAAAAAAAGDTHDANAASAHLRHHAANVDARADANGQDPAPAPTVEHPAPCLIVVMGVSGSGKSTLGHALGKAYGLPFLDGDDLHPPANVAKMSAGTPLTDADRAPWLVRIRTEAERVGGRGAVVACSALRRAYRDVLRGKRGALGEIAGDTGEHAEGEEKRLRTVFVHPHGTRESLVRRMESRTGHFMKASMLDSQLAVLEDPAEDGEGDVVCVGLDNAHHEQLDEAKEGLARLLGL